MDSTIALSRSEMESLDKEIPSEDLTIINLSVRAAQKQVILGKALGYFETLGMVCLVYPDKSIWAYSESSGECLEIQNWPEGGLWPKDLDKFKAQIH